MNTTSQSGLLRVSTGIVLFAGVVCGGCESDSSISGPGALATSEPKSPTVHASDFARAATDEELEAAASGQRAAARTTIARTSPVKPEVIDAGLRPVVSSTPRAVSSQTTSLANNAAPKGGEAPTQVSVGSTPPISPGAKQASREIILDSLVGQVNGKPIFASEVLEPLDGRLRSLGGEVKTRELWVRKAGTAIYDELLRRVRDELVLAEARANLSTDQKQGLLYFLNEIQQNLVSSSGGSAVQADEQLRESTSRSLSKEAQDRLDRELIANELRQRVVPRVAVSWKDVQNEYEKNFEKYNPPPVAHVRMIVISSKNADAMKAVQAGLSAGQDFGEIAATSVNQFNSKKGGELDREIKGSFGETEFSAIKEVNDEIHKLSPGQTSPAFTYRDNTAWVRLESIETRPGKTLYEAQYDVEQELKAQRFNQEERRYFENLLKRGNVSKFEGMMEQLLGIAAERYMPQSMARARDSESTPSSAKPLR